VKQPYNVVDNSVEPQYVTINPDYLWLSDNIPYPIPENPLINPTDYDKVLTIINRDTGMLYSMYHALQNADGTWSVTSAGWYDLSSNELRDHKRSPSFQGQLKYEEVMSGTPAIGGRIPVLQRTDCANWPIIKAGMRPSG
jgi:hypothetical protein